MFVQGMSATALACAPSLAFAQAAPSFAVERTAPDRLALSWSGMAGRVAVYASSDPAAPPNLMRALAARARGPRLETDFATAPRPYFVIAESSGAWLRAGERVLPLQGAQNFRDLGGYRSESGKRVRWGLLYRSAEMSGLTVADYDYLRGLGIKTVCDFRSTDERAAEPTAWPAGDAPDLVAADYDLRTVMAQSGARMSDLRSTEDARAAFASFYVSMPTMLAAQYRDMFQSLLRRDAPLAFHCTAGKDRTGMAAALILSVLGVPRQTIIEDYALSQLYYSPTGHAPQGADVARAAADQAAQAGIAPEVAQVFMGADPGVLTIALNRIDAEQGGPVALVKARYGLTDDGVALLRRMYLE